MLRECIDDLRLTIDSLESADNELLPALGNFRYRIERRLRAVGIELDWQVSDLPELPYLSPRNLLHILRILQEAFANVLKHARATRVMRRSRTAANQRRVFIRVSDNGTGLDATTELDGQGMGNMARRAASFGGELQHGFDREGTTMQLLLPIV